MQTKKRREIINEKREQINGSKNRCLRDASTDLKEADFVILKENANAPFRKEKNVFSQKTERKARRYKLEEKLGITQNEM